MIRVVNVWHHYGVRPVLKDVSLHVECGRLVAVMGPNGMGKSTLLTLIGGLLWPLEGFVEIDGKRRRSSIEAEIAIRKKLVYLPDQPFLPPDSTGREFLLAVGRLYEVGERRLMEHADHRIRGDTADLLGKIGSPEAIPALKKAAADKNPDVVEAVEEALEEIATGTKYM